jgi:hypothetical protein
MLTASTGGVFSGGASCGVGCAVREFQSCVAAMRGVRDISGFGG